MVNPVETPSKSKNITKEKITKINPIRQKPSEEIPSENNLPDEKKSRPVFKRFEMLTDPNDPYYFPAWNPTNNPQEVSCGDAAKLYMRCSSRNINLSKRSKYFDTRIIDCRREFEDIRLCLNVMRESEETKKRILLEKNYPWICDKTQGFRYRHVWKFRERPPASFADERISDKDYALMRESVIKFKKGGVVSHFYYYLSSPWIYNLLEFSPFEFSQYLYGNKIEKKKFLLKPKKPLNKNLEESQDVSEVSKIIYTEESEIETVFSDVGFDSSQTSKNALKDSIEKLNISGFNTKTIAEESKSIEKIFTLQREKEKKDENTAKVSGNPLKEAQKENGSVVKSYFVAYMDRKKKVPDKEGALNIVWRGIKRVFKENTKKMIDKEEERVKGMEDEFKIDLKLDQINEDNKDNKDN